MLICFDSTLVEANIFWWWYKSLQRESSLTKPWSMIRPDPRGVGVQLP
jgi:hypothetical protein